MYHRNHRLVARSYFTRAREGCYVSGRRGHEGTRKRGKVRRPFRFPSCRGAMKFACSIKTAYRSLLLADAVRSPLVLRSMYLEIASLRST